MSDEKYSLKVGQADLQRMTLLGRIYAPYNQAFILSQGLTSTMVVADIGCGPGNMTTWFAEKVKDGRVFGIDQSAEQLAILEKKILSENLKNIVPRQMDIFHLEELGQQFDMIFCRWLFIHLHNHELALQQLRRVLKPDGKLIICDFDNSSWSSYPPHPAMIKSTELVLRLAKKNHIDPEFGPKIYSLLRKANFQQVKVEIVQPILDFEQRHYIAVRHQNMSQFYIENGFITADESIKLEQEIQDLIQDENLLVMGARMFQVCGVY